MGADGKCSVMFTPQKWASFYGVSVRKWSKFAQTMTEIGGFSVTKKDIFVEINCPKMLEIRDEHTKRLGSNSVVTQEQLGSNSGARNKKQELELDKDIPQSPLSQPPPKPEIDLRADRPPKAQKAVDDVVKNKFDFDRFEGQSKLAKAIHEKFISYGISKPHTEKLLLEGDLDKFAGYLKLLGDIQKKDPDEINSTAGWLVTNIKYDTNISERLDEIDKEADDAKREVTKRASEANAGQRLEESGRIAREENQRIAQAASDRLSGIPENSRFEFMKALEPEIKAKNELMAELWHTKISQESWIGDTPSMFSQYCGEISPTRVDAIFSQYLSGVKL